MLGLRVDLLAVKVTVFDSKRISPNLTLVVWHKFILSFCRGDGAASFTDNFLLTVVVHQVLNCASLFNRLKASGQCARMIVQQWKLTSFPGKFALLRCATFVFISRRFSAFITNFSG